MLKRISLLFLCLALLFPVRVFAQNDLPILVIEVDLWPEYDRASMLVIYRITLAPGNDPACTLTPSYSCQGWGDECCSCQATGWQLNQCSL